MISYIRMIYTMMRFLLKDCDSHHRDNFHLSLVVSAGNLLKIKNINNNNINLLHRIGISNGSLL
jgi:hypothetical protein